MIQLPDELTKDWTGERYAKAVTDIADYKRRVQPAQQYDTERLVELGTQNIDALDLFAAQFHESQVRQN